MIVTLLETKKALKNEIEKWSMVQESIYKKSGIHCLNEGDSNNPFSMLVSKLELLRTK